MKCAIEISVPDIGDFKEVEIIELLVRPGDMIKVDQPLVTVESDKASMEIPTSRAGRVLELKVGLGEKVSEGTVLLVLEVSAEADVLSSARAEPARSHSAPATSGKAEGTNDIFCDVLVLGGGPGGYSAAFRAADLGLTTVLVEKHPTLGGVCLNVGCIPSKALLHAVGVIDEASCMAAHGIMFSKPDIDLQKLRSWKNGVVRRMTTGLASMAKGRKVNVVQGVGRFVGTHRLEVTTPDGTVREISFNNAVIAAGSSAIMLPFVPSDPRIVDSTGALALPEVPQKLLVIGGGIIGLEMATVYSSLGARVDVVEMGDGLMQGADRDLVKAWQKRNHERFDRIMTRTRATALTATVDGIHVVFASDSADAAPESRIYDMVLVAVGRRPNGKQIDAVMAGVAVDEEGFILVDSQMRTNVSHIFAIGDIVGQPMLAHKAVHEGHVAAEVIAEKKTHFDVRVIPSVAYTHPEVAWAGLTEEEARSRGLRFEKAVFPWAASARAVANGCDEGFTKLLFDVDTHQLIGGAIVGSHAGDLIGEIAVAIEMGADAVDIARTIHPHPTLGETIGMAAEVFEGTCTDVMPTRARK